jgi:hypothetical protein
MVAEAQRIDILFPVRIPVRYPYLAQILDTSQTLVGGVPTDVGDVGQAEAPVVHRTMQEGQHVTGEPLALAALDHIASRSSSAGLVAPAAAEEIAALRYSLSLSIHLNMCKISFIR